MYLTSDTSDPLRPHDLLGYDLFYFLIHADSTECSPRLSLVSVGCSVFLLLSRFNKQHARFLPEINNANIRDGHDSRLITLFFKSAGSYRFFPFLNAFTNCLFARCTRLSNAKVTRRDNVFFKCGALWQLCIGYN